MYWILNGTGNFPKTNVHDITNKIETPSPIPTIETKPESVIKEIQTASVKNSVEVKTLSHEHNKTLAHDDEKIERIIVFYSNGTFKEYNPK